MKKKENRYTKLIEEIFLSKFKPGQTEILFERGEIERAAKKLDITLPKNLGDLIYSFRYRNALPESIVGKAPKGKSWIILPAGRSKYRFVAETIIDLSPNGSLAQTKIPDATPGVISMYALNDEQALLAKLRYNRLIDIFTRVTCYSMQNHLRTTAPDIGQIETDEIYVGVDRRGAHYVFPVQAKGGKDNLSVVQIQQDLAMCAHKFPSLICRPIAAQFMVEDVIALFEFVETDKGIKIASEKHYRLVAPDEIASDDLRKYRVLNVDD